MEDTIHDALRIVAYSMESQNWELVGWLLKEHNSKDLGAYFFPVIAQVWTASLALWVAAADSP